MGGDLSTLAQPKETHRSGSWAPNRDDLCHLFWSSPEVKSCETKNLWRRQVEADQVQHTVSGSFGASKLRHVLGHVAPCFARCVSHTHFAHFSLTFEERKSEKMSAAFEHNHKAPGRRNV